MNEFSRKERQSILSDEKSASVSAPESAPPREPLESIESVDDSRAPIITPPPPPAAPAPASAQARAATAAAPAEERTALYAPAEANDMRARWDSIQVGFVDEPRKAVQEADELVAVAMNRLTEIFAQERQRMEKEWDRGGDISTEDLRIALRRYRSFFNRLLNM